MTAGRVAHIGMVARERAARVASGPLRLSGLPPGVVALALVAIGVLMVTSVLVVLSVLAPAWEPPGGVVETPNHGPLARVALIVLIAGVGAIGAVGAYAAALPAARHRIPVLVGLAVLSAAIGGYLMVIVNDADLPGSALAETGDSAMGLIVLGALVAFASGAVLASAPWWIRPTPRVRAALAAAAAAPFACILLLPLAPGIGGAEGAIADAALLLQATSALATGILALWGAFALVRTARGLAVALPAAAADGSRILITLLVLKLGWVAVGYAGLLPPDLSAQRAAWTASLDDGLIAWALAATFAAGAMALCIRLDRRVGERSVRSSFWVVVAAFAAPAAIGGLVFIVAPTPTLFLGADGLRLVAVVEEAVGRLIQPVAVATMLSLPLIAVVLWAARRRSAALALLLIGLWALPRSAGIALAVATGGDAAVSDPLGAFRFQAVSFDAALTVAIALIVLLGRLRGRSVAPPRLLLVVLVTSSLLVHGGSLTPDSLSAAALVLVLLYPIVWELVLDGGDLNRPGPLRASRTLNRLAAAALLLLLAMVPLAQGAPSEDRVAVLAREVLLLPYALLVVLAWWGRERRLPALDDIRVANHGNGWTRLDAAPIWMRAAATVVGLTLVSTTAWLVALQAERDAVAPGAVRFGRAPDEELVLLANQSGVFIEGDRFTWMAHLRRPAPDGSIWVEVTRLVDRVQSVEAAGELTVEPDQVVVLLGSIPEVTLPGTWRVRFSDHGEPLADGTYEVTPAE